MNKKPNVRIIYKNGHVEEIFVVDLVIKKAIDGLVEVSWSKAEPRPMYLGINEIMAIYDLAP